MIKNLCSILHDRKNSDNAAILCSSSGKIISYCDMHHASEKFSGLINEIDNSPGARVALLFHPSIEFSIAFFAILYSGKIAIPIDRYMKEKAFEFLIQFINPSLIITSESQYRKIPQSILDRFTVLAIRSSFCCESNEIEISRYKKAPNKLAEPQNSRHGINSFSALNSPPDISPYQDALYITTSGTTGLPKIVRLSHEAVLRNIQIHLESLDITDTFNGLQTLELNYSYGLIASFLAILYSGGTAILVPRLDIPLICNQIKDNDVDLWLGTPFLFKFIIENAAPDQMRYLSSLKKMVIGGDHCVPELRKKIVQNFPFVSVNITYGLTEAGPRVTTLPSSFLLSKESSVGLPLKDVRLKIVDMNLDRECRGEEIGQILIESPTLMSGYYRNLELSQKMVRSQMLYTGDLGYLDTDGFLHIKGRIDNQFKFRGRMINPKLIEDCITSLDGVLYAQVSNKMKNGDASITAEISIDKDIINLDMVKRHCMKHMPMYMVPSNFELISQDKYFFKGKQVIMQ